MNEHFDIGTTVENRQFDSILYKIESIALMRIYFDVPPMFTDVRNERVSRL